ncbi:hypothetical protein OG698_01735 [Streptomyces sp. NBC_01003]|uniref:hypothetical protein n=1 Tax=Streptomyces sp. NBC_01003 TaxID=2903714 RepID=UPI00386BB69A|nr:hypothetical protein OG698_01735 [Streptomyces sp. NBC_01003]
MAVAPIVVHPPLGTGGRRVTVRGQILGLAYSDAQDSRGPVLFEAAFCFSCHEVRMHGLTVPSAPATQFFDADTPPARALLVIFRVEAP